jgi:hypothetical protein
MMNCDDHAGLPLMTLRFCITIKGDACSLWLISRAIIADPIFASPWNVLGTSVEEQSALAMRWASSNPFSLAKAVLEGWGAVGVGDDIASVVVSDMWLCFGLVIEITR